MRLFAVALVLTLGCTSSRDLPSDPSSIRGEVGVTVADAIYRRGPAPEQLELSVDVVVRNRGLLAFEIDYLIVELNDMHGRNLSRHLVGPDFFVSLKRSVHLAPRQSVRVPLRIPVSPFGRVDRVEVFATATDSARQEIEGFGMLPVRDGSP